MKYAEPIRSGRPAQTITSAADVTVMLVITLNSTTLRTKELSRYQADAQTPDENTIRMGLRCICRRLHTGVPYSEAVSVVFIRRS
jgi:hypothetical protein